MTEIVVDIHCTLPSVKVCTSASPKRSYDCTLNQANIDQNHNKFYILQLLVGNGIYYVYSRYGRVGENGKSQHKEFSNEYDAVKEFQARFRSKTGNMWTGDAKSFIHKTGKYMLMDTVIPDIEIIEETPVDGKKIGLDDRVSGVVSMISNKDLMTTTMQQLDVDTRKLPLGKISDSQITLAHQLLKKIKEWVDADISNLLAGGIKNPDEFVKTQLTTLSSKFWTLIPYSCGRNRPPIISAMNQVEKYADLLEVLENLKIAGKIFRKTNNLDDVYTGLDIAIDGIERYAGEWKMLETYITNTHASTHHYKLELLDAFSIDKVLHDTIDTEGYFDSMEDHRLLIHGSRMVNYMGIFGNGLRIPLPSQVSNGSVLGLGAYFADSISKSFNYCRPETTDNIGFVVLCEVAMGSNPHVVQRATFDNRPPTEYTSRIALGTNTPGADASQFIETKSCKNVSVPCGKLKSANLNGFSGFRYNEFVVYDPRQYRFRYLLKLKCNGSVSCW